MRWRFSTWLALSAVITGGLLADNMRVARAAGAELASIHTPSGTTIKAGIGFGTALAISISWSVHKSILWAVVHGFFSWLYVIYYALTR